MVPGNWPAVAGCCPGTSVAASWTAAGITAADSRGSGAGETIASARALMTACVPGRPAGSLPSSAPISSRSGPACCGGAEARVRIAAMIAVRVGPSNGGLPSIAVYRVAPRAHMSAAGAGVAALQLFGGHVVHGADPHPGAGQLGGGVDDPGDAEIGHDGRRAGQQDVVRLQVTVHDAGGVRVRERVRDLLADLGRPPPGQPAQPRRSPRSATGRK